MTDRPILFSGSMVRALLDGRKSQTRRVAWRDAMFGLQDYASEQLEEMDVKGWMAVGEGNDGFYRVFKPTPWQRISRGDRLWVKETWNDPADGYLTIYRADYPACVPSHFQNIPAEADVKWKPSIFLPRRLSRMTLLVTSVRGQRLCDIIEADARAEGIEATEFNHEEHPHSICFSLLWDSIHGAGAWNTNPWIVALTFDVVKANIDTLPKAEAA